MDNGRIIRHGEAGHFSAQRTSLILAVGVWYFAIYRRKKEEKKTEEIKRGKQEEERKLEKIKEEIKNVETNIENGQKVIGDLNSEIDKLEKQKETGLKQIEGLEEKRRHSKGEVKERYEREMRVLRDKNEDTEKRLVMRRKNLLEQEAELETRETKLGKRTESYWKEKALNDSGQKQNLKFNEKGYLVFKDSGKLYHVWKYEDYLKKKGQKIPENISIHHIDRNRYNNEIWNLTPLDKRIHDINNGESIKGKFNHNLIEIYNWGSGIQQLKEQLNMDDLNFPEHIQKKLKEEKNNKF